MSEDDSKRPGYDTRVRLNRNEYYECTAHIVPSECLYDRRMTTRAASGGRQARRGPAPFASFDHDVSDEVRPNSSPESKQNCQLPELPEHRLAPRIDISRASSSSHHDSRDSSPELAEVGAQSSGQGLGFKEDGTADLRSSTEELAFLEPEENRVVERKDSAVSCGAVGRHSRVSSTGSAWSCGRLSVCSAPRSPSPHRMLLETSFCGPRPLDAAPDLEPGPGSETVTTLVPQPKCDPEPKSSSASATSPALVAIAGQHSPVVASPRIRTEATIEHVASHERETPRREAERRPQRRRRADEPEVYRSKNKNKDVIRIRLKPDSESDSSESESAQTRAPDSLELVAERPAHFTEVLGSPAGSPRNASSRKSSLASLFRPLSPRGSRCSGAAGGVLSLFRPAPRTPRRSPASPAAPVAPHCATNVARSVSPQLKYYDPSSVIHIPLHSPPHESPRDACADASHDVPVDMSQRVPAHSGGTTRATSTAPATSTASSFVATTAVSSGASEKPLSRTVLPDGSVIIPLHSPTERCRNDEKLVSEDTNDLNNDAVANGETATGSETKLVPEVSRREPEADICEPVVKADSESSKSDRIATVEGDSGESSEDARSAAARSKIQFTTHVGSRDQLIFTTQLSLTNTPGSELTPTPLRENRVTRSPTASSGSESDAERTPAAERDEQETAERRRLVLTQESWEEELPRVATTLPQERPRALPMRPVSERGEWRPPARHRPRALAAPLPAPLPPPAPQPQPPAGPALRISLPPSRHIVASLPAAAPVPAPWVNFEEVPERRRVARRITLVPHAESPQYAAPDECRCECHQASPRDDELPLLKERRASLRASDSFMSDSSQECGGPTTEICVEKAPR